MRKDTVPYSGYSLLSLYRTERKRIAPEIALKQSYCERLLPWVLTKP